MIPKEETIAIEFKSDRKTISDNAIVEEVVALSNTDGGDLYIGVEDDGVITGAQQDHRDPKKISAIISSKTVPSVTVRAMLENEAKPVMHIEVPRSASIVATSSGRILRRRLKVDGSPECAPMYPHEISTRLSDLGRLDYSAQPVPDATREDFDPIEREHLRELIRGNPNSDQNLLELPDEELEQALRFTVKINDEDVPTLAGLLMIGRQSAIANYIPTHEGVFQVLNGTDVRANTSYSRPLLYVIDKIDELIEPWNTVTEVQAGLAAQAIPLFDKRAIREAIVNAFGHRDYSVLGRVRVQIDDGGLQITNPGGFIEGISIDNLLTAEPHGRNPCLMDALKRAGLAERTGRGIDRIYEGSLLYGRPLPDYTGSNGTMVSLFIAKSKPDEEFIQLLMEERRRSGNDLPLQSLLVLDALKRSRRCSMKELNDGLDISEGRIRSTVEFLTEAGLVEAVGSGRNRSYVLGRKVYKRSGKTKEYVRQTDIDKIRHPEMIMKLARQQGKITTADVAELLHLQDSAAYYEIKKLQESGELRSIKQGRHSYYEPCKQ